MGNKVWVLVSLENMILNDANVYETSDGAMKEFNEIFEDMQENAEILHESAEADEPWFMARLDGSLWTFHVLERYVYQ